MNVAIKLMTDSSNQALNEILLLRHHNGIKLRTRRQQNERAAFGLDHTPLMTLCDTMDLPFNLYFNDLNHQVIHSNNTLWQRCGFNSRREFIGQSASDICKDQTQVLKIYSNDNKVLHGQSLGVFEEDAALNNNMNINSISFKMPLYDNEEHLIGVFGCSTVFDSSRATTLADQIATISKIVLASPKPILNMLPGREIKQCYFSKREVAMINLIIRGKTMREVGLALNISTRTAENYFANMKSKVNAISKSDFIDKVIDFFI